jgi:acyl-CoA dehydrogenase
MDFKIPEDMKMIQTLARDFVNDQLIPLEKEVLGRESDLEGAKRYLAPEKEAELINMAKEMGFWGLNIPEELGGAGMGVLGTCLVEEELAKTVLPFNFGDITPVLYECNEEQRKEYLTPVLDGQKHFYLALVEPGKGSDPSAIETRAQKGSGGYILNGQKLAFTRTGKADFAIVFAVTDPGRDIRGGVTCFLVDIGTEGMIVNRDDEKAGWRSQVARPITLVLNDCKVSQARVLGEEGKAFQLGKKWLADRRIVRGARCVGAAVRLLEKSNEYVKSWTSFGQVISEWPHIQALLADMAIDIHAARLMVYHAACQADENQNIRSEASMVKVFATQMLKRVADRAVLIKNGPGPVQGLTLEYLCQSLLVQNISDRALEVQKSIIAGEVLRAARIT